MPDLPRSQKDWLSLRRLIARVTRDPQHAEDRLQASIVKLLIQRKPVENAAGFLVATSRNLAIDEARKAQTRREIDADAIGLHLVMCENALPDEAFAARKRLEKVSAALDSLPDRTRRIFLMHRLDGLRYREIAAREQISMSSVEKHMAKAILFMTQWDEQD